MRNSNHYIIFQILLLYDNTLLSNILVGKQFIIRTLLFFGFNGGRNDQLNFFCPLIKLHEKPNIIFLLLQFIYLPVICHQRKPTYYEHIELVNCPCNIVGKFFWPRENKLFGINNKYISNYLVKLCTIFLKFSYKQSSDLDEVCSEE